LKLCQNSRYVTFVHRTLDNDGKHSFVENFRQQPAGGRVRQQRGKGIGRFQRHSEARQCRGEHLDIAKPHANPGTAGFHHQPYLAGAETLRYIVGFHLFGPPTRNSGTSVFYQRIGE
jgi:hypothetical protein